MYYTVGDLVTHFVQQIKKNMELDHKEPDHYHYWKYIVICTGTNLGLGQYIKY